MYPLQGLSPRVRGNRNSRMGCYRSERSIPACAGEPAIESPFVNKAEVYPRVCGGTGTPERWTLGTSGLSPRVRGNPSRIGEGEEYGRSIPACAGEPSRTEFNRLVLSVYPRVCGGTGTEQWRARRRTGLSPRVRGNHGSHAGPDYIFRSIPACAGEPKGHPCPTERRTVYPRVCGGTVLFIPTV